MEPKQKTVHSLKPQVPFSIRDQAKPTYPSPLPASDSASPILIIAVLSIVATVLLLVSYYIFVNKCCSTWHQFNPLRRFSLTHSGRLEDPFIALSPTMWNQGLEESIIREIPAVQFRRQGEEAGVYGCVVCLNEFQEQDMLRVLPKCSHAFHLDCIDIWLQSNANCPLCRTSISGTSRSKNDQIVAPSSSPQNSEMLTRSLTSSDEDFVVIELGGVEDDGFAISQQNRQGRDDSSRVSAHPMNNSPGMLEQKMGKFKPRKCHHASIMGDERIDVREKDEQFTVQPIRRSFSMDSAADQQLYLAVQEIIQKGMQIRDTSSSSNEESCSRFRRSIFPLRHGRARNAILPLESDT